jgi:predicted nucleotidyltransferase
MPRKRYYGRDIPIRAIRRYARQIAEMFHPEKIILFGSRAWGTPHDDSDVDLLVVMPARNELDQAVKIRLAISAPFPMDLLVYKPANLRRRLDWGDSFLKQVTTEGKVLYNAGNPRVGSKGRRRLPGRNRTRGKGQSRVMIKSSSITNNLRGST